MEYGTLSGSGLPVSRIGFGCEQLGGTDWGNVDKKLVTAAVQRALELGVNIFDTADVYGLGRSETRLSEALGEERHKVIVSSKFGVNWIADPQAGRAKTFVDCSPARVTKALEQSLRRLRLECIPLYFVHWPDPRTPVEETMLALQRCQTEGKVRHIGLSNFSAEGIRRAHAVVPISAVQTPYNLIQRQAEEETLRCCNALGISAMAYGPLAQGLLSGKYSAQTKFADDDRRHRLPHFRAENVETNLSVLKRIQIVAAESGKSPSQIAIRWVLEHPAIVCAIVGAKAPNQIEENVGALGWRLPDPTYRYLASGHCQTIPCDPCQSIETK